MILHLPPFRFWSWWFLFSSFFPFYCPFTNLIKEQTSGFLIFFSYELIVYQLQIQSSLLSFVILKLDHVNIYPLAAWRMLNWINRSKNLLGDSKTLFFMFWYVLLLLLESPEAPRGAPAVLSSHALPSSSPQRPARDQFQGAHILGQRQVPLQNSCSPPTASSNSRSHLQTSTGQAFFFWQETCR